MTAAIRQLGKEYRALLPAWLAAAGVIGAAALRIPYAGGFALPAYFVGAVAVGALSFGHEYTSRALPLLLAQPCGRGRLVLLKLAAAAPLVSSLAFMTHQALALEPLTAAMVNATALLAILLSPWLTMVSRNVIAGAVFTLPAAGLLLLAGDVIATRWFGPAWQYASLHDGLRLTVLRWGALLIAGAGAILTWRTFARLEAIEGAQRAADLPRRPGTSSDDRGVDRLVRRHRAWLLIKKELHLQKLAMAVAVLYVCARMAVAFVTEPDPTTSNAVFVMSTLYAGMIAMLIGALASAEERQFGTLEWQLLVPMPLWQQWIIKVTVALSLTWLLGGLLPRLLFETLPSSGFLPRGGFIFVGLGTAMLATIVVGSLYISTLCSSGLWALVLSLPAAVATGMFLSAVASPIGDLAFELARGGARLPPGAYLPSMSAVHAEWFAALPLAGVLALVVWFALLNHRAVDRSGARVTLQLSATAAAIIAFFAIVGVLSASLYRL